jgi:hypothetical protein
MKSMMLRATHDSSTAIKTVGDITATAITAICVVCIIIVIGLSSTPYCLIEKAKTI